MNYFLCYNYIIEPQQFNRLLQQLAYWNVKKNIIYNFVKYNPMIVYFILLKKKQEAVTPVCRYTRSF